LTAQNTIIGISTSETTKETNKELRPLKSITKVDAIDRVHNREFKAVVARDIGVLESTLRGWCKKEEKIRTQLNKVRFSRNYKHIFATSSLDNSDNNWLDFLSQLTPIGEIR